MDKRPGRLLLMLIVGASVLVSLMLTDQVFGHVRATDSQGSRLLQGSTGSFPGLNATNTYTHCRFGVGESYKRLGDFDISGLNLGWYLNWTTLVDPPTPYGMEFVHMLDVSSGTYVPSGTALVDRITANPGAYWLIGNEPDCIYQSDLLPEEYAQVYHEAYTFIKGVDPTAKIVAGNIVQPTPVRMTYLNLVLDAYYESYGEQLPVDAWGIHSFILNEASCDVYPENCWGAGMPPGVDADRGFWIDARVEGELDKTDDLDIFRDRLVDFRQWMAGHGYRNVPLFITEYGSLIPDNGNYAGWDYERTRTFMYGTFDYMLTASDPLYGYPADENRLVQRWVWYSLADTLYGGALFHPDSEDILPNGTSYGNYTSAISPTVDLFAVEVTQKESVYSPTEPATVTVRARVSNVGNMPTAQQVIVRFFDGNDQQIGSDQLITTNLAGCAAFQDVQLNWSDLSPGVHTVKIVVDPDDTVNESDESNNVAWGTVLVAEHRLFLPVALRYMGL